MQVGIAISDTSAGMFGKDFARLATSRARGERPMGPTSLLEAMMSKLDFRARVTQAAKNRTGATIPIKYLWACSMLRRPCEHRGLVRCGSAFATPSMPLRCYHRTIKASVHAAIETSQGI